jgi:DNA-binding NarL/FixJ family response regulator
MNIWVQSPYLVFLESLVLLLEEMGFVATSERTEESEIALWDLTISVPPFPQPSQLPTLAIISGDESDAIQLFQRRYRGYIKASDDSTILKRALEAVLRGEIWADRRLLTRALDRAASPQLTVREHEVYRLVLNGLSNRAVAERLGIAVGTVKMHVSRLFDKLGVKSRTELMVASRDHRL